MPVPWPLIRRKLAAEWGVRPWEVDAPELADEIGRQIELWNLEAQYAVPAGASGREYDED